MIRSFGPKLNLEKDKWISGTNLWRYMLLTRV